jgi:hypothetical protein
MNFMNFQSVGNFIIPTDELHHFSEGVGIPPISNRWFEESIDGSWVDHEWLI